MESFGVANLPGKQPHLPPLVVKEKYDHEEESSHPTPNTRSLPELLPSTTPPNPPTANDPQDLSFRNSSNNSSCNNSTDRLCNSGVSERDDDKDEQEEEEEAAAAAAVVCDDEETRHLLGMLASLADPEAVAALRRQPKNISPFDAKNYCAPLPPKRPEHAERHTLFLDLDLTLVHTQLVRGPTAGEPGSDSGSVFYCVTPRPFLAEFLREVSLLFEVVIFTAAKQTYADRVLQQLDPQNQFVHGRLYREHCVVSTTGVRIKDLSLLGRDLRRSVIIDDVPGAFQFQPRNGVRIPPFAPAPAPARTEVVAEQEEISSQSPVATTTTVDRELLHLLPLLRLLSRVKSVYTVLDLHNARLSPI